MGDEKITVQHIEIIPDSDLIMVNFTEKDEYVQACPFGNIVLANYTVTQARLRLYATLEKLDRRVLYFDTDSIIYIHKEDQFNPETEERLGGWTDELKGKHITRFVSGGPKNYGYEVSDKTTYCKVKGLTLNYQASQIVNFNTMLSMVKGDEGQKVALTYPSKITRERGHVVRSRSMTKQYRVVYDKRRILPNLDTLPFGYVDSSQ